MVFFKSVYDTIKLSVLVAFVVFLLEASGVPVFHASVNNFGAYIVIFLFILTAVLSANY